MSKKVFSAQSLGYAPVDKRFEILRLVAEQGSISQAARSAGISYKAAWQAIHTLSNLTGEELLDSSVGGAGGGGARLTEAGEQVLAVAEKMQRVRHQILAGHEQGGPLSAVMAPQTSMRNLLPCTVARLQTEADGQPLVKVQLRLPAGERLQSSITRESAQLLGLRQDMPLLLMCKATAVNIRAANQSNEDKGKDTVNCLRGRVLQLTPGQELDELTLTLGAGLQLVGFADAGLHLQLADEACAFIEPHALVLALT